MGARRLNYLSVRTHEQVIRGGIICLGRSDSRIIGPEAVTKEFQELTPE